MGLLQAPAQQNSFKLWFSASQNQAKGCSRVQHSTPDPKLKVLLPWHFCSFVRGDFGHESLHALSNCFQVIFLLFLICGRKGLISCLLQHLIQSFWCNIQPAVIWKNTGQICYSAQSCWPSGPNPSDWEEGKHFAARFCTVKFLCWYWVTRGIRQWEAEKKRVEISFYYFKTLLCRVQTRRYHSSH